MDVEDSGGLNLAGFGCVEVGGCWGRGWGYDVGQQQSWTIEGALGPLLLSPLLSPQRGRVAYEAVGGGAVVNVQFGDCRADRVNLVIELVFKMLDLQGQAGPFLVDGCVGAKDCVPERLQGG